MKTKKLKPYGIALVILLAIFVTASLVALHFLSQCYADEYWWLTRIPESTGDLLVPAMVIAVVITLPAAIVLFLTPLSGKATVRGAKALSAIIGATLIAGTVYAAVNTIDAQKKLEEAKPYAPGAFFGQSCFIQESLDGIEEPYDPNSSWLLYIGRSDCDECKVFEETWSSHFSNDAANDDSNRDENGNQGTDSEATTTDNPLFVYDTTLDRNGERSQEMKALLDSWGVDSVPCVVEFKGNTVVKVWSDPSSSIDEIVKRSNELSDQD